MTKYLFLLLFITGCESELTTEKGVELSLQWANNLGIEDPRAICFKRGYANRVAVGDVYGCDVYGKNLNSVQKLICYHDGCHLRQ